MIRFMLKPVLAGMGSCIITLLHMNRLSKTESAIFISLICSLLLDDLIQNLFYHNYCRCPNKQTVNLTFIFLFILENGIWRRKTDIRI